MGRELMRYAHTTNGRHVEASPGTTGHCSTCAAPVIAKCGEVNVWHWAHQRQADCDVWSEPVGAWHRAWQEIFPLSCRERVIGPHRADIAVPGAVIELQDSPLSTAEIRERERFYASRGRFCWVFNVADAAESGRLEVRNPGRGDRYRTFRWKHARRSLAACRQPVYLDLGGEQLLQLGRIYHEAPVGGWGYIVTRQEFIEQFMRTAVRAS